MFFLTSIGGWVFYPPPPFLSPQLSLASFGEYWAPCLEPARDFGQLDGDPLGAVLQPGHGDRKSTRLNSSHGYISYAVFCLKKKKKNKISGIYVAVLDTV